MKTFIEEMRNVKNVDQKNNEFIRGIIHQVWEINNVKIKHEALERLGASKIIKAHSQITRFGDYLSKFPKERVFHSSQIKKMSIKYRLMFRDITNFKGVLDTKLADKVITLEKNILKRQLIPEKDRIFVLAPSKLFTRIKPIDYDPLVFLALGEGYYYLIHQWGNDLSFLRKILFWPLRTRNTLAFTIALIYGVLLSIVAYYSPTTQQVGFVAGINFIIIAIFSTFLSNLLTTPTWNLIEEDF